MNQIFDYIYYNNVQGLKDYLTTGDINIKNEKGMSLLIYSMYFKNTEIFNLLIDNYINLNLKDNYGNTAVHYAVIFNQLGYLKTLIRLKAKLDIKNNDGKDALYLAFEYSRENIVGLLLESIKFDINNTDNNNNNILMAIIKSQNINMLNLLDYSKVINYQNSSGVTPLMYACMKDNIEIVKKLLDNNAYVNMCDNLGNTAFIYACKNNNSQIASLLLSVGALYDIKNKLLEDGLSLCNLDMKLSLEEKIRFLNLEAYKYKFPIHYGIYTNNILYIKNNNSRKYLYTLDYFSKSVKDLLYQSGNLELIKYVNSLYKIYK